MENIDIRCYEIEELGIWPIYTSNDGVSEGEQRIAQHLKHERNSKIVKIAKELFKSRHNGRVFCEVCNFDFGEVYGDWGEGFIEAHHKKPISQMLPGDLTKVEDLIMVCSNCHSMLHKGEECISHEDLKKRVNKKTKDD